MAWRPRAERRPEAGAPQKGLGRQGFRSARPGRRGPEGERGLDVEGPGSPWAPPRAMAGFSTRGAAAPWPRTLGELLDAPRECALSERGSPTSSGSSSSTGTALCGGTCLTWLPGCGRVHTSVHGAAQIKRAARLHTENPRIWTRSRPYPIKVGTGLSTEIRRHQARIHAEWHYQLASCGAGEKHVV